MLPSVIVHQADGHLLLRASVSQKALKLYTTVILFVLIFRSRSRTACRTTVFLLFGRELRKQYKNYKNRESAHTMIS